MADISKLGRLIAGALKNVDLSQNALVVGSLKVGSETPTELTKAILDNLVSLQAGGDAGALHNHDGAYYTEAEVDAALADKSDVGHTHVAADVTDFDSAAKSAAVVNSTAGNETDRAPSVSAMKSYVSSQVGGATPAASAVTFDNTNSALAASNVQDAIDEVEGRLDTAQADITALDTRLDTAEADIAALEALDPMEYKGNYDASTNSPALADGVGNNGDIYRVSVAGTQNLGSGAITFAVGDKVVYNGTLGVWEKWDTQDEVTSVNGQQGAVVLDTDDISEGSTNQYHTAARAKAAAVVNSLAGSETDQAPSVSAVNAALADKADSVHAHAIADVTGLQDALDAKQDASANLDEADAFFGATDLSAAEAEQLSDGSNADALHKHSVLKETRVAGEAFAANTTFAVRLAKNGETVSRVYKADKDASSAKNYNVIGLAQSSSAVSAGQNIEVVTEGVITLGASDTPFAAGVIGEECFLGSNGAIIPASSLTDNSGEAAYVIGVIEDTNKIRVGGKHLRYIA